MRISELARAAAVNVQTIRFYEREKLLRPPLRDSSGYRRYQESDLDRLNFIRRNHEIGFTLAEIKQLLQLHAVLETMPYPLQRFPREIQGIAAIGRQRLEQVNEKIKLLTLTKKRLQQVLAHLSQRPGPATCPMFPQTGPKRPAKTTKNSA